MRSAYRVETVRAAEAALMARLPEGALMQRAAAGLAAASRAAAGAGVRRARRPAGGQRRQRRRRPLRRGPAGAARRPGCRRCCSGRAPTRPGSPRCCGPGDASPTTRSRCWPAPTWSWTASPASAAAAGCGPTRSPWRAARGSDAVVVAVDLPSGVDADTGTVDGEAVRADATVTFGAYKPGLLVDPAREYAGPLRLVDIGLGPYLPEVPDLEALQHADVARLLPVPGAESDKYRRGVVGGGRRFGALPRGRVLAVTGRCAAGRGPCGTWGPAGDAVLARHPETLVHAGPPGKAGARTGVGDRPRPGRHPGCGGGAGLRRPRAGRRGRPAAAGPRGGARAGRADRADPARGRGRGPAGRGPRGRSSAAAGRRAGTGPGRYGATVLLKGSTTLVADPGSGAPVRGEPGRGRPGWPRPAAETSCRASPARSWRPVSPRVMHASAAAYPHGLAARRAARGAPWRRTTWRRRCRARGGT